MNSFGVIISLAVVAVIAEDVSVKTNVGTFVGFRDEVDLDGTKFHLAKFLGIPYAEAPVGDLRFRKPVPKLPLTKPLEVKQFGSACMQVLMLPNPPKGSEDCLFLNVFAPATSLAGADKIPVMVWIPGGGFTLSSANAYKPDRLVANGPVIVVTMNYRLSIWGFLATGDSNSPGNYGLWDQHLAIKWVHDNIGKFGGDPNRVTIFGESAGSISAIYHGCYPGNRGLFQRIIAQSGSTFAQWGAQAPILDAKEFASLAGCESDGNKQMVECLRGLDNNIINGTMNDFSNGLAFRSMFMPCADGEFIEIKPDELVEDAYAGSASRDVFASFDLLTGVTSGEGYFLTPPGPFQVEGWEMFLPSSSFFKETLIPQSVYVFMKESSPLLTEAIVAEYTDLDEPENPEKIRERYTEFIGDLLFLMPMWSTVDFHAGLTSRPSSYMYYFTANPSKHAMPTPSWATRPTHGDDMIYVFGGEGDLTEFGITENVLGHEEWEQNLMNDVMTMWTNFAKTGNPNRPRDLGIDWLPYTKSHQHYLDISKKLTSRNVKTRIESRRVNFWKNLVPDIIQKSKETSRNAEETCEKDGDCPP